MNYYCDNPRCNNSDEMRIVKCDECGFENVPTQIPPQNNPLPEEVRTECTFKLYRDDKELKDQYRCSMPDCPYWAIATVWFGEDDFCLCADCLIETIQEFIK